MRQKFDLQRYFSWANGSNSKIVRQYEEKYNRISEILDSTPPILELADRDLKKLSIGGRKGRKATYTSENLLRALVVHQIEQTALRDTMIRISHGLFLQDFIRLGPRPVMDYSTLDKAFKVIQPKTWDSINGVLRNLALDQGRIDPSTLRVDTTVVEANIHWPTDSSLLWDGWRVLHRLIREGREYLPVEIEDNRFHFSKVKKLYLNITRYSTSKNKSRRRKVKRDCKKLIAQGERISRVAEDFSKAVKGFDEPTLWMISDEIESYLPKIRRVIEQATRAWILGEVVPARERIFSIFEDHVELIKRGRRHKPVEFGHMILLGQTKDKFITQYDVMEKRIPDCMLPGKILEKHKEAFGSFPDTLAADKGFRANSEYMKELRKKVKVVAIPERLKDWADEVFVGLQHFRAGIEGSISVLKRAFGLLRCQYRGFKSFMSHVSLGVFCHNLVLLTGPPMKG